MPILSIIFVFLLIEGSVLMIYQHFFFTHDTVEFMNRANYFAGNDKVFWRGWMGRSIIYALILSIPTFVFSSLTGITKGISIVVFMRFVSVFFATLSVYLTFLLGKKAGNWKVGVVAAALLVSTFPFLYFSLYPREHVVALVFILLGYFEYFTAKRRILKNAIFGLCIGIAFICRYDTILFLFPIAIESCLKKKLSDFFWSISSFLIIVLFHGFIDYFIWGISFGSIREYINFNFLGVGAVLSISFKKDVTFYLTNIVGKYHYFLPFLFFGVYNSIKRRKHIVILLPTILFLFFLSIFNRETLRFMYPTFPFLSLLIAFGLDYKFPWFGKLDSKIVAILILVFFILNLKSNYHNFELKSGYVSAFEYLNDEISKGNLRKKVVYIPLGPETGRNLLNTAGIITKATVSNSFFLQYGCNSGATPYNMGKNYITTKYLTLGNTKEWKNQTWNLGEVKFNNDVLGYDFRIVHVIPIDKIWINLSNITLELNLGENNRNDKIIQVGDLTSCTIENRKISTIREIGALAMYFNIKDEYTMKKSNVSITIQYYDSNDIMGCLLCGRNLSAYAITNSLGPFKCDDAKLIKSFDDVGEGKVYLYEFGDNER